MRFLLFFSGAISLLAALFLLPAFTDTRQLPIPANSFLSQVVRPIDLERNFTLGGEAVPMYNPEVSQRLDRELMLNAYQHAAMLLQIKRSNMYFRTFENILAENGVPDDFKYLAVAESALGNTALSSAGAKGLWQFMPATGREYGLEINEQVDERLHLEKSTRAACKMLRNLHNKYNSWTSAAAAYNMGAGGLSRDAGNQKVESYYDVYLNQETSRYVFRIIAIKDVMQNPESYGFFVEAKHLYPTFAPSRTVVVDASIGSLTQYALDNGTNLSMLKYHNPWLVGNSLTVRAGKTYEIAIP